MVEGIQATTAKDASGILRASSNVVGKDDFLKLLTFQMKNQNPLKPYDNQEFASQLAQFSQLEQLIDIRALIEETANSNALLTATVTNSALPGMLGKQAKALTDTFTYDGESSVKLGYDAINSASSGKINIKDESGFIVRTLSLNSADLSAGNHQVLWDGKSDDGTRLNPGRFKFEVKLFDRSGGSYTAETFVEGKVEAVRFKGEGTMLVIGGSEIPLGRITDISAN